MTVPPNARRQSTMLAIMAAEPQNRWADEEPSFASALPG